MSDQPKDRIFDAHTPAWAEQEVADGDRICAALGLSRNADGALPIEDILSRIANVPAVPERLPPADRLTEMKARGIATGQGYTVTGYVLRNPERGGYAEVCIIDSSAVRWLTKDAMWELLHGPDRLHGDQPNTDKKGN